MGVDQPDVDTVIRIGCPPTIESMVQEFGRAGRDGRQAQGMFSENFLNFALQFVLKYTGILFYQDCDLQHAAFWRKSNADVLQLFSHSWRYSVTYIQCAVCKTMYY